MANVSGSFATLGFSDKAESDERPHVPTAFALKEMTPAEEAKIGITEAFARTRTAARVVDYDYHGSAPSCGLHT